MASLNDILMQDGIRQRVIADSAVMIDQEVGDRKGVTGLAIKGGYKIVKRMKANFVQDALDNLIDDFMAELDPFYQEHGKADGFDDFMVRNKARVADGLLGVTDRRRDGTSNRALRKAYDKLRPLAKANVEQAVPRLSRMIQKYLTELA